jgi:hypothetical protein
MLRSVAGEIHMTAQEIVRANRDAKVGREAPAALILGGAHGSLAVARSLGRRGIPVWFATHNHPIAKYSRYVARSFEWAGPGATDWLVELSASHRPKHWVLFTGGDSRPHRRRMDPCVARRRLGGSTDRQRGPVAQPILGVAAIGRVRGIRGGRPLARDPGSAGPDRTHAQAPIFADGRRPRRFPHPPLRAQRSNQKLRDAPLGCFVASLLAMTAG